MPNRLSPVSLCGEDRSAFLELNTESALCCLADKDTNVSEHAFVCFEYLNQGGANVIFKIHKWPHPMTNSLNPVFFADVAKGMTHATPLHHQEMTSKVLRVNKGVPKTLRSDEVIAGFYNDVRPLFMPGTVASIDLANPPSKCVMTLSRDLTEHLMEHEGVPLFPEVMIDLTQKSDAIRQESGTNSLTSQRLGILLPNMSPTPGSSITLEIKPKWLLQSPTAPANAVRCRTCALQVVKPKDLSTYICPLHFSDGNRRAIYPWIFLRVQEQLIEHSEMSNEVLLKQATMIAEDVTTYLTEGDGRTLLKHLQFLQRTLDPHGVLRRKDIEPKELFERNLRLAMTLRDCSMYIRVSYSSNELASTKIECKLGDLDFKSADKMDDWEDKERTLLGDEAYTRKTKDELNCFYPVLRASQAVAQGK